MIKENQKRITVTLPDLQVDCLEAISKETGLTKSTILKQLLFSYVLNFWSDPEADIKEWKAWKHVKENGK